MSANVDHTLQEPQVLHARVSAIGTDRTFIRDRLGEIDACILEAIDSGKHLRPDHTTQRLVARICAAVINMSRYEPGDNTVFIKRNSGVAESPFVAVSARSNVFRARLHPLDRPSSGFLRSQRTHCHLGVVRDLNSETAADVECFDAYAVDVDAEVRRNKLNG